MISGHKTLGYLDNGVGSVRKDINRIDNELNKVSEALHTNRHRQAQVLKGLAKIRLDEISQESFLGDLDTSDQLAITVLGHRQEAYERLENNINQDTLKLEQQEQEREAALVTVNIKAQAIIDCEQQVQGELEIDKGYQTKLLETKQLDSIADEAEEKAEQAEQDRVKKGEPYEKNKLFMYLWKRHYGTSEYSANPLTRYLDSWVESYCDYDKYRLNYWTLLEIPKRLKTHAETVRSNADSVLAVLTGIETERALQAGLHEIQQAHNATLEEVDKIDDKIELLEDELNSLLVQRTQFAEAKDTYMTESLEILATALGKKDIYQLNRSTYQTTNKQDDLLAREFSELHEHHNDLEEELSDHRRMHEAKLVRLQELEGLRRQFKNNRFDDLRSGFGNESLIKSMLGQFLSGLVDSGELWRVLQRHQRHRDVGAWPDFGSGGLGRTTRRRSPWHLPSGRSGRSGGGFRLPKTGGWSSRGRGGGFRTGGGF